MVPRGADVMTQRKFLCALGIVASLMGADACQSAAPRREASRSVKAVMPSLADARPVPSTSSASGPDASTETRAARRVAVPGLSFGQPIAHAPPDAVHPKGTLVALAWGMGGSESAGLVEIDVGTGNELRRSAFTVNGVAYVSREGDAIHVAAVQDGALVWVTTDLALNETRRVSTKKGASTRRGLDLLGFAVIDGKAFVVNASHGAAVEVFDAQGKRLASHDCNADVGMLRHLTIERAGSLAVVGGLVSAEGAVACAVRIDGGGAPLRRTHSAVSSFFTHDGKVYVQDPDQTRRLDLALAATGPAIPDPRSCDDPHGRCGPSRCESGVSGDAALQMFMMSDVLVVRTVGCCGGPPGGLFFCDHPLKDK